MSLDAIVGHARPVAQLKAALRLGRIAHAYLFHGEDHIGKRTTALAVAKTALCTGPSGEKKKGDDLSACGICPPCRWVEAGNHPDLQIVQPDGAQIKIGQIRKIQEALSLKPVSGDRKWYVIDRAEALNPEASNAFLKTLEEPPDHSTLILITSRPQALLPTVRSRCQMIRFYPAPRPEVAAWLVTRRGLDRDAADRVAALTAGRIGAAAEADPDALVAARDRILNVLSPDQLGDLDRLFAAPEELADGAERLWETLDGIEIILRDILIRNYTRDSSLLFNPDIADRLDRRADAFPPDRLLEALSTIHTLRRGAARNLNPPLVLESVLLSLRDALSGEGHSRPSPAERAAGKG